MKGQVQPLKGEVNINIRSYSIRQQWKVEKRQEADALSNVTSFSRQWSNQLVEDIY